MDWAAMTDAAFAGFELSSIPPTVELPALPYVVTLSCNVRVMSRFR